MRQVNALLSMQRNLRQSLLCSDIQHQAHTMEDAAGIGAESSGGACYTSGGLEPGTNGEVKGDAQVDLPRASTTSTGSVVKGWAAYWENMVHRMFSTILALVRSVAVTSMNTSVVSSVICRRRNPHLHHNLSINAS